MWWPVADTNIINTGSTIHQIHADKFSNYVNVLMYISCSNREQCVFHQLNTWMPDGWMMEGESHIYIYHTPTFTDVWRLVMGWIKASVTHLLAVHHDDSCSSSSFMLHPHRRSTFKDADGKISKGQGKTVRNNIWTCTESSRANYIHVCLSFRKDRLVWNSS